MDVVSCLLLLRADALVKLCDPRQEKYIRNCIYYGMGETGRSRLIKTLAYMRLDEMGLIDEGSAYTPWF